MKNVVRRAGAVTLAKKYQRQHPSWTLEKCEVKAKLKYTKKLNRK